MLHKNLPTQVTHLFSEPRSTNVIHLANRAEQPHGALKAASPLSDLLVILSRRCSSFFAEAAVLVLVFGILDYFMLKGRIELGWIAGALALSLGLLAASIALDFSAQRWIKAHP